MAIWKPGEFLLVAAAFQKLDETWPLLGNVKASWHTLTFVVKAYNGPTDYTIDDSTVVVRREI